MRYLAILMLMASAAGCFWGAFTRKPITYRFAKGPGEVASAARIARVARFLLGVVGICLALVLMFKG